MKSFFVLAMLFLLLPLVHPTIGASSFFLQETPLVAAREPSIWLVYVSPDDMALPGIQRAWNNALGWVQWEVNGKYPEDRYAINADWAVHWEKAYYYNIWDVLDRKEELWGDHKVILILNLERPYGSYWAGSMTSLNVAFLGYWSVFAFERDKPFYKCVDFLGRYPCSRDGQIGVLIHEMLHLYGYGHDDYSIMGPDWARWPATRLPEGVEATNLFDIHD